jgi:prevent-host-death family protein
MDQTISAADANRSFSRILGEVRAGATYAVTSHGKPVARIIPCDANAEAKAEAWRDLMHRLKTQPASEDIGPWRRDELYDE